MPAGRARTERRQARTAYKVGEVWDVFPGTKQVEATYWSEYCYHAQMEPMNAVASWFPQTASPRKFEPVPKFGALIAFMVSGILKTTPDKIIVHQQYLGGGFGRRILPPMDWNSSHHIVEHREKTGETPADA